MDIQTGASLAGYTILRELGAGGMGAVYLVNHPRLPRQDAMKVIHAQLSSDPVYAARFGREAELACGLDHPSLVRVYDRGFDEGRLWLTMHYVQGLDLDQLLRRDGPVDPIRAVWMVSALADALDYAHDAGLVHRDVKPANILLSQAGSALERIYLTDFGIAHATDASVQLTDTGDLLASLPYAAPEQLEGRPITGAVDVYALGCVLYELVTGRRLFDQSTPSTLMGAVLRGPPVEAFQALPPGRPELEQVVRRALSERPEDRFPTCAALAEAARAAVPLAPSTIVPPPRPSDSGERREPAFVAPQWPPTEPAPVPPQWPPTEPAPVAPQWPPTQPVVPQPPSAPRPSGRRRRFWLWAAAALVLVVAAAAVGIWLVRSGGPGTPTSVEASATAEGVEVRWREVDGAAEYEVYRDGRSVGRSDGTVYLDKQAGSGTRVAYSVAAVDSRNHRSARSEPTTVVSSLNPVTNLTPQVRGGTVRLTWTPVDNAETYEVRRDGQVVQSQITNTSFVDEQLSPGRHTYTVAAFDDEGAPSSSGTVDAEVSPWLEAAGVATAFDALVPDRPGAGGWGNSTCNRFTADGATAAISCNLPSGIYVEYVEWVDQTALNTRIAGLSSISDPNAPYSSTEQGGWYRQSSAGTDPAWESWGFTETDRQLMEIHIAWSGHTIADLDTNWYLIAPWQ